MANANKIEINTPEGKETLIDLTGDGVTPETLDDGVTAHDATGAQITGIRPVDVVRYGAQTLTEEQKAQARKNIDAADADSKINYIVGNSTTAGAWTGTCDDITEYYEGLTVLYKINVAGVSSGTTLNINGLGAVAVKRNASTAVTTIYPVGSVVMLTYSGGAWLTADYDANTKNSAGTSNKASTKMYLVGATSQTSSGTTTYTNSKTYIGEDNCLYSNGKKVAAEEAVVQLSEAVEDLGVSKVDHSDLEAEVDNKLDGRKAEFVAELIAQIGGMPVFGTVNDDKTITVTSTLADGVYTLMYTDVNGSLTEVGMITIDNNAESYINLVPTSIDADGSVFNGNGYQNDAYLSSSTGKPSSKSGYVATGYMELGYEWYMKGATWASDTSNRIMWYNDSFGLMASNAYVTGAAMGSGVTATDIGNGVTKFTISQNWAVIKGYKYVRMSLTGAGENLIISATPIE